jgi:hypothetical protein
MSGRGRLFDLRRGLFEGCPTALHSSAKRTSQSRKERTMAQQIVKVSVEVRSGAARFCVSVQAESIRKALGMVKARYPQGAIGVVFPIEPEDLFVDDLPTLAGMLGTERPKQLAA